MLPGPLTLKNLPENPATLASLQRALLLQSDVIAELRNAVGGKDLLQAAERTFDLIEAQINELRETGGIA